MLEYLADVDDVQYAIKSLVNNLFLDETISLKMDNSSNLKQSIKKIDRDNLESSRNHAFRQEDYKKDLEKLDDSVELGHLNESHNSEVMATHVMGHYESRKRAKPSAMLARYNESTIK